MSQKLYAIHFNKIFVRTFNFLRKTLYKLIRFIFPILRAWYKWSKEADLSEKSDGLQRDFEIDGTAGLQCVGDRQTHQRLPDGRPLLAAIQRR